MIFCASVAHLYVHLFIHLFIYMDEYVFFIILGIHFLNACFDVPCSNDFPVIMDVLWKRLFDAPQNWRYIYKSLVLMDHLVKNGNEQVIGEVRRRVYDIQQFTSFRQVDEKDEDVVQGSTFLPVIFFCFFFFFVFHGLVYWLVCCSS